MDFILVKAKERVGNNDHTCVPSFIKEYGSFDGISSEDSMSKIAHTVDRSSASFLSLDPLCSSTIPSIVSSFCSSTDFSFSYPFWVHFP